MTSDATSLDDGQRMRRCEAGDADIRTRETTESTAAQLEHGKNSNASKQGVIADIAVELTLSEKLIF